MRHHLIRAAVAVTTLIVLAACAGRAGTSPAGPGPTGGPTGSPATSAAPAAPRVTLTRSGGFAGFDDRIVVESGGGWTATDRAGKQRTGTLSTAQRDELTRLATSPAFAAEATRPGQTVRCSDAISYAVTAGAVKVSYADCPTSVRPATAVAITRLLATALH
ncbi:MAG TPA: hypothetical protein VJT31_04825 [Rugosimonospora sp.]|nr:hypothetical protein [Rugosimonospora sp.]